ncbi:MAG: ABC transporter ATP-binding protein [Ktedonobacteraceae bacterium]
MNAEFYGFLGEQLAGTEDVRANGAIGYVMVRFYHLLRGRLPPSRNAIMSIYAMVVTTIVVFAIGNAIAFVLGAYLWTTHAITIGTVYIIFYYTNLMIFPMEQIRAQLQDLQGAGAGLKRVQELLHTQPAISDGIGTPLPAGALAVDVDDVTFGYQADDPVLHRLDFHIQPGSILGVLGRTGSGKTTLARLVLRLYDPQQGQVRIGGVPVRELHLHDLRQAVGMVTQDVQLFHATVRENLTFFNTAISDERIVEALEDLGLATWYRALPQGLDTELGSDGQGLSAGEAQLLAFTRVFLANPRLVILDEATSRLDPATERLIERAMDKLFEGRTGIIIAHRLATVERTDDILVLQGGCIQEYGPRTILAKDVSSRFYHLLQTGLEEVPT